MVNPKLETKLRREMRIKLGVVIVMIVTGLVVVLAIDNMLASFVLAFVTTYLLSPIVDWLERRGIARHTAIMLPFIATGLLIALSIYLVLPLITSQLMALELKLPQYQSDLVALVARTEQRFRVFFNLYNVKFSDTINAWLVTQTSALSSALPRVVSAAGTVLLLTPLFAFFMLQDGRAASRKFLSFVPNSIFETALNLHHQLNEQMGGFIRARFLEAAIVGFVVGLGLQIMGFPYASLLGLFAAITNLIPYLGPIIGAVPAILIALISQDAQVTASLSANLILVTTIYFFAQLVDVAFIIPLVVARMVNLHPVTVVIVIIIGAQVLGILGMVISIPVASGIKLIFHAFYDHVLDARS